MSRKAPPTLLLLLALVALDPACPRAWADDVRPVSLHVREAASRRYDVRFQVPMRGRARLRVRPHLPPGAQLVPGTYDQRVAGDSSIERFAFDLEGGLVGHSIGVEGLALGSRNALLRVRLLDGRDLRAVLGGMRPVFLVEPAPHEAHPPWTAGISRAALDGIRHGGLVPAHVLLALGLVLALPTAGCVLALGLFLLLDVLGAWVGLALPTGIGPSPGLAEGLVCIVACLAARQALLGSTRRLSLLAALAGLVHGWSLAASSGASLHVVGYALGLDLAHLALGGTALLVLRLLGRPGAHRAGAWVVGTLAVAVALASATQGAHPPAVARGPGLLPASQAGSSATPGRAAPPPLVRVTSVEAYLDIGVFGTRLEMLARWETLGTWLGSSAPTSSILPVEAQSELLDEAAEALLERTTIRVDGREVAPDDIRPGFAVQESTGTYIRLEAVPENASDALVGITCTLPTPAIPQAVEVTWSDLPQGMSEMRARVIDPEISREVRVPANDPRLTWENDLQEDPLPAVETIRVERRPLPLPLASLGLLFLTLVMAGGLARRGGWSYAGLVVRVGTTTALLILSVATLDLSGHVEQDATPTAREAKTIVRTLLDNMYRAFNVREEEAVYDRLALSLTETTRRAAYRENRRTLALARVGGARTHIDVVELVALEDVRPISKGGFESTVQWTVAGSVTHFGHRHLRQNLYRARLAILPIEGTWKIDAFELEDVTRQ